MAITFQATESKSIFVGRDIERTIFADILVGKRSEWIIHIPGEGGIGKTRLLETLQDDAFNNKGGKTKITHEMIDFYNAANQTGFGFLSELARTIGSDLFQKFSTARSHFIALLESEPEPVQRHDAAQRVLDAFLDDYKALLMDGFRVVWLLDTCEEMGKAEEYVLDILLPQISQLEEALFAETDHSKNATLHRQTVVIIAGRKELDFTKLSGDAVLIWKLKPLSLTDVKQYFAASQTKGEIGAFDDEKIEKLYQITGGRPLYLALSYDWLKNEIGTVEELLTLKEPLGEKLVGWVRRLDTPEKRAILYTALAWRRMEPSLLGQLLEVSEEDALNLIGRLSKYSFVKYRPGMGEQAGAFQLHDEMRDLITKYVNLQEGTVAENKLLAQVIHWYKERIDDNEILLGQKLPSRGRMGEDLTRALLAESLYYECQQDLATGYDIFDRLFRNAIHYLDLAFCELLNREVDRFAKSLSADQKDDLRFKEALDTFRREQYSLAGNIWHSLVRRDDLELNLKATSLMLLVELDSYVGKPDEAIEHAKESEETYSKLLSSNPEKKREIETSLGKLYNNWGYAHRVKGDFDNALMYYEKALANGGQEKNIARTLNNMGYIYFLRGNIVEARTYVGRALQLRRKLKIQYESGLGYNTMGIILEHGGRMEDAADSYQKALAAFEEAGSERGQAMVLVNLGRIDRMTNRFEEADAELTKAISVFERKGDTDFLITVLNELACVYRQRGVNGDWDEAENLFMKSLSYSQEMGRVHEQVDNLEDLCILYEHRANRLRKSGMFEDAEKYTLLARENASKVDELAKSHEYTYILAKKERTLGDLSFGEQRYEEAFEHYFESCRLVARSRDEESPILGQRRYEETVDRLQEQLQALPSMEETSKFAESMLKKFESLVDGDKQGLSALHDYLKAAKDMTIKVKYPIR